MAPAAPVFLLLVFLPVFGCSRPAGQSSRAGAPGPAAPAGARVSDVVLVTIDTLRADAVGFAGKASAGTRALDRLAAEGAVYANAHASSVVTLPSHATMLTGLYPTEHGVRDNTGFRLGPEVPTLATLLTAGGWATGAFVAAFPLDSRYGLDRGFAEYDDELPPSDSPGDFAMAERPGTEVVAGALDWWRRAAGRPRFLWVHLYEPHAPYRPPPAIARERPGDAYQGEVAAADAALAPLFDAVRAEKKPPLLVVTADHGEALGDHGEATHGLFAYEATLKVPLVVWCPGVVAPTRSTEPARHVDLLPTILAFAGVPTPSGLAGRPLGAGGERPAYFEAVSASFNRGWAPLTGVLDGGWKLVHLPIPELYDLSTDPQERVNRFDERRDVARRLQALLPRAKESPGRAAEGDSEEARRLLSLGYLSGGAGTTPASVAWTAENDPKRLVDLDAAVQRTISLHQTGRTADAAALAHGIVKRRPAMSVGWELYAYLLEETGRSAEAVAALTRARQLGVASEAMQVRLALALSEAGRPLDALEVLRPLASSPDPDTQNAIGIAFSDAGRSEEALAIFSRILERDPEDAVTRQNVGIALLKRGAHADALASLDAALAVNARLPRAWNARGVAQVRLGNPREAARSWARAAELDPRQYDALFNRGLLAAREGDRANARAAFERFIRTAPPSRYAADIAEARRLLRALPG